MRFEVPRMVASKYCTTCNPSRKIKSKPTRASVYLSCSWHSYKKCSRIWIAATYKAASEIFQLSELHEFVKCKHDMQLMWLNNLQLTGLTFKNNIVGSCHWGGRRNTILSKPWQMVESLDFVDQSQIIIQSIGEENGLQYV